MKKFKIWVIKEEFDYDKGMKILSLDEGEVYAINYQGNEDIGQVYLKNCFNTEEEALTELKIRGKKYITQYKENIKELEQI